MAVDFSIKTGDTAPAIVAILKDALGTVVNLSSATVQFVLRDKVTNTKVVDAPAIVTDAAGGTVVYGWQAGDTDIADTYNAEFEVHWPDGTFETFPNNKYLTIRVYEDLGGLATHIP